MIGRYMDYSIRLLFLKLVFQKKEIRKTLHADEWWFVITDVIAALTVYDMVKAVEKSMRIEGIRLILKDGGKSGRYEAEA